MIVSIKLIISPCFRTTLTVLLAYFGILNLMVHVDLSRAQQTESSANFTTVRSRWLGNISIRCETLFKQCKLRKCQPCCWKFERLECPNITINESSLPGPKKVKSKLKPMSIEEINQNITFTDFAEEYAKPVTLPDGTQVVVHKMEDLVYVHERKRQIAKAYMMYLGFGENDTFATNDQLFFHGDQILTRKQADDLLRLTLGRGSAATQKSKLKDSSIDRTAKEHLKAKRKVHDKPEDLWPGEVWYILDNDAASDEATVEAITQAVEFWGDYTCLKFNPIINFSQAPYDLVIFDKKSGCSANVGKIGGIQTVSIGTTCEYFGTAAHELAHALGMIHEHQRPDRRNFVNVNWDNIYTAVYDNFEECFDCNTLGVPYDYGSVMHYNAKSFSSNRKYTIEPKDPLHLTAMGSRLQGPTFYDVMAINLLYCKDSCVSAPQKATCLNNGYPHPSFCDVCICPEGFSGQTCELVQQGTPKPCGGELVAGTDWTYISSPDYPNFHPPGQMCSWVIKAPSSDKKIELEFTGDKFGFIDDFYVPFCYANYVELRYSEDLANTGPQFCGLDKPLGIYTSETHQMVVLMRAYEESDSLEGFQARFRISENIDSCFKQYMGKSILWPNSYLAILGGPAVQSLDNCKTTCSNDPKCRAVMQFPSKGGNCLLYNVTCSDNSASVRCGTSPNNVVNYLENTCFDLNKVPDKNSCFKQYMGKSILWPNSYLAILGGPAVQSLENCKTTCSNDPKCKAVMQFPSKGGNCLLYNVTCSDNSASVRCGTSPNNVVNYLENTCFDLNTIPKDCLFVEWESWSSCSSTCGQHATRFRVRTVAQSPDVGGRQCEGPMMECQNCGLRDCNTGSLVCDVLPCDFEDDLCNWRLYTGTWKNADAPGSDSANFESYIEGYSGETNRDRGVIGASYTLPEEEDPKDLRFKFWLDTPGMKLKLCLDNMNCNCEPNDQQCLWQDLRNTVKWDLSGKGPYEAWRPCRQSSVVDGFWSCSNDLRETARLPSGTHEIFFVAEVLRHYPIAVADLQVSNADDSYCTVTGNSALHPCGDVFNCQSRCDMKAWKFSADEQPKSNIFRPIPRESKEPYYMTLYQSPYESGLLAFKYSLPSSDGNKILKFKFWVAEIGMELKLCLDKDNCECPTDPQQSKTDPSCLFNEFIRHENEEHYGTGIAGPMTKWKPCLLVKTVTKGWDCRDNILQKVTLPVGDHTIYFVASKLNVEAPFIRLKNIEVTNRIDNSSCITTPTIAEKAIGTCFPLQEKFWPVAQPFYRYSNILNDWSGTLDDCKTICIRQPACKSMIYYRTGFDIGLIMECWIMDVDCSTPGQECNTETMGQYFKKQC